MASIVHKGNVVQTKGDLPAIGSAAPGFRLTNTSKQDVSLETYSGKKIVMNIFPSIDTGTCATSVRTFNKMAATLPDVAILCISKDLPFAHKRFCAAEGIQNVHTLSQYKDSSFSDAYHVDLVSGTDLEGLMSRAIVVIDENGKILHTEQVSDLSREPDYDQAIQALR